MKRAQGETVAARALASTIDEAAARVQRAPSEYCPRVNLTEVIVGPAVILFDPIFQGHQGDRQASTVVPSHAGALS